MAKLNREQIAGVAKAAGFSGTNLADAVAIALAESGGDTTAHNTQGLDDSYGLWQINMKGALGPDRRKRFNLTSNDQLFDPATNARVAHAIFKAQGFQPWTTYTRGEYLKYQDGTNNELGDPTLVDSAKDAINPINGLSDAVNSAGANVVKGASNLAGVAFGIALLVVGVVLLGRGAIGKVLPTGKALKAIKAVSK